MRQVLKQFSGWVVGDWVSKAGLGAGAGFLMRSDEGAIGRIALNR